MSQNAARIQQLINAGHPEISAILIAQLETKIKAYETQEQQQQALAARKIEQEQQALAAENIEQQQQVLDAKLRDVDMCVSLLRHKQAQVCSLKHQLRTIILMKEWFNIKTLTCSAQYSLRAQQGP